MFAKTLVAPLLAFILAPQSPPPAPPQSSLPTAQSVYPQFLGPYAQEIFFAVLDGLYRDGVTNEVVDKIVVIDEESKFPANFVWGCPVCMPAFNAFRVYRSRPRFVGLKLPADTFGTGLPPEMVDRLSAADQPVSQAAIEELIQGWMNRRQDKLRLTTEERAEWRMEMEKRRKRGTSSLDQYREQGMGGSYAAMKTCPICEGANGARETR